MSPVPAVFAIPGDIETLTGGYIYEKRLLLGLRDLGHDVAHLPLGASFPDATAQDMNAAIDCLGQIAPARVLILDGLVYGSIDPAGLARVRAPIVAMIHHPLAYESGLSDAQRQHLFDTERRNLALAQTVLVPSSHTAQILSQDYGVSANQITIARPGTDQPAGPSEPKSPPLILTVGLQHPRKGHDVLLQALHQLRDLTWQAAIVGRAHDLAYADTLAETVRALDLSDRVTLTGVMSSQALQDLYACASVFALATRYEGYGIVFDEALSWGLPIVACRTGAVPDTVPAEAGLLCPPDDPAAISAALRRVLEDDTLRVTMARGARLAGKALPGWSETARIASRVLEGVIP
ncbi:MAG: glycosyltransferase family 4 protein [Pseudomonadota bacterium]